MDDDGKKGHPKLTLEEFRRLSTREKVDRMDELSSEDRSTILDQASPIEFTLLLALSTKLPKDKKTRDEQQEEGSSGSMGSSPVKAD